MDFKKHADTIIILAAVVSATFWMTTSISNLELKMAQMSLEMTKSFHEVDMRLSKIEDVLILKGIVNHGYFSADLKEQ